MSGSITATADDPVGDTTGTRPPRFGGSRRIPAVAGGALVAALLLALLWWTNRPGPAPAKLGDCVTTPAGGKFTKVDCSDGQAKFQVIGSYDGHDSSQCDQTPKTLLAVLAGNGTKEWILCLGEHK